MARAPRKRAPKKRPRSTSVVVCASARPMRGPWILRFVQPVEGDARVEVERIMLEALAIQPVVSWPSSIRCELEVATSWTPTTWRAAIKKLTKAGTAIHATAPLLAIVVGDHLELHRTCDTELGWILSTDWPNPGSRELDALEDGHAAFVAAVRSRIPPSPLPDERVELVRAAHHDREMWVAIGDELLAAGDSRGELLSYTHRSTAADDPQLAILEHRFGTVFDVLDDLVSPRPRGLGPALANLPVDDRLLAALLEVAPKLSRIAMPRALGLRLVTYALGRPQAETIIDNARGWVARDPVGLGNAIATAAYSRQKPGKFPQALALYDLVIDVDGLPLNNYNNALWTVMADNNKLPIDPTRHRRFLAACVRHGRENPGIFYNAACVHFELGEIENTLEMIELAIQHGYHTPQQIRDEPLFAPIATDPRFAAVFENTRHGRVNRQFPNLWTPSERKT